MELRPTPRGYRIVHGAYVISELLAEPGPTHSVVDLIASAIAVLSPGPSLALLGFAAGGLIAPLRGLGIDDRVDGVDLDLSGAEIFRRVSGAWAGEVHVVQRDALELLRDPQRHPCIVEDLSMQLANRQVQKPEISFSLVPRLIAKRLTANGVALINLLPTGPRSWPRIERQVAAPFADARIVELERFENRILVGARSLPDPLELRRALDGTLSLLGSRLAGTVRVRSLKARTTR